MVILRLGMVPVSAGETASQLACTPGSLQFGAIVPGETETLLVTVTNPGQTSVTVSGITLSNSEFSASNLSLPLVLPPGQSVDMNVSFSPTSMGFTAGTIKFSSNASNATLTIEVAGTGVSSEAVTAVPSSVSFGQVAIGSSATVPVVLTNDRPWNVILSEVQTTGREFSMKGATFPLTLGKGQSVTLNVIFTPESVGMAGGSALVSGPKTLTIPLIGTGKAGTPAAAGQLTVTPATLNFGSVPDGTTVTQSISLSAVGSSVTVSSSASSSSQFVLNGATFPLTIAAGQSVSFNVAFTPQSSGTASGSLSFASNASSSSILEQLTGTGTATRYNVNLSWNPSSDVTGYNVYRSTTATGQFSKINSSVTPNTAYSDSTVVSGQTYYYAATSVNTAGQESALSTPPVAASVP
ncbi:MAG: choice-of-anchor D domain-containing protein [Candidatus Sulfotelmatobacter sp.]